MQKPWGKKWKGEATPVNIFAMPKRLKKWESEAPAELALPWFGRSLTLATLSNQEFKERRLKSDAIDGTSLPRPNATRS